MATESAIPQPGPEGPPGFRVLRSTPHGRHPLLSVFPGLGGLATAERQEPDPAARTKLFGGTCVEVVPDDIWMYVAPWEKLRTLRRRRFEPVIAPRTDCIVIGSGHLQTSPALMLFMDIHHELCHVQQRHRGEELFDRPESYVRRPTELEAYRFVVDEARRFGVDDEFLREYLRVEWISEKEFNELLRAMDVPTA
jgi:hypothetical protein